MNTLMRRSIRIAVMSLGVVGLVVAFNAIPGAATPPVSFASQLLGRGTYMSHGTLPLEQGSDIVVLKITVAPGGSSGWHSHPGGAIVIVQQGEITVHTAVGNHCDITTYTHGQSFVERPDEVDQVVNSGTTDYVLIAVFPGTPVGGSSRIDQPDPGTCPAS